MDSVIIYKNNNIASLPIALGKQGESNVTKLKLCLPPQIGEGIDPSLLDYRILFYFESNNTCFPSPILAAIQDETVLYVEYLVEGNCLTEAGSGQLEVCGINSGNEIVWKSTTYEFTVNAEVPSDVDLVEGMAEWMLQLQTLVDTTESLNAQMIAVMADMEQKVASGYFKGDTGIGIPAGGRAGEMLVKTSDMNYDTRWQNYAPGIGVGSVGDSKLDREVDSPDRFRVYHDDVEPRAIGDSHLQRVGNDAVKLVAADLDEPRLKDLANNVIDLDFVAVGCDGDRVSHTNRKSTYKDKNNHVRVIIGDVLADGSVNGLQVWSADGQTCLFDANGVTLNGIPQIGVNKFDNAAVDLLGGLNHCFYQALPPTDASIAGGLHLGDVWYDTDDGYKMYKRSASTWDEVVFDGSKILSAHTITAAQVVTGFLSTLSLTADDILAINAAISSLSADKIAGGTLTIGGLLGSNSYNGKITVKDSANNIILVLDRTGSAYTVPHSAPTIYNVPLSIHDADLISASHDTPAFSIDVQKLWKTWNGTTGTGPHTLPILTLREVDSAVGGDGWDKLLKLYADKVDFRYWPNDNFHGNVGIQMIADALRAGYFDALSLNISDGTNAGNVILRPTDSTYARLELRSQNQGGADVPLNINGIDMGANGPLMGLKDWADYACTTAGITLGNGTLSARVRYMGKSARAKIVLTLGTTSAITGGVTFSVPTATVRRTPVNCLLADTDLGKRYGSYAELNGSTISVWAQNTGGTYGVNTVLSSIIPHTWASTDVIEIDAEWEIA